MKYVDAVRTAFDDLLTRHSDMVVLGQGLWSPFYVGRSMDGLDEKHGRDRVMDTPVSENATTGIALGYATCGSKAVVVHPRMDFLILAVDQIVNEAAKWRYVLGNDAPLSLTVRGIINRGGEQGAQHSQALQSWFAHIPGLRVVMPATPVDAYRLLVQSVESGDPVVFIEDRWSYGIDEDFAGSQILPPLSSEGPRVLVPGDEVTLVGIGHSTNLCLDAAASLLKDGVSCEVVDLRILNPLDVSPIVESVQKTRSLLVVDGGWATAGMAGEVIARVCETAYGSLKRPPRRVTLPDAPAPSSVALERLYYPTANSVVTAARELLGLQS